MTTAANLRVRGARLVVAPLARSTGRWLRYCPGWFMTGMPATWTTSEPKLRAAAEATR